MSRRAFTLLEVIVAMGVLAIGATAAFGLLVAATAAGKRAEHHVNAALLAETLLNDLHMYPLDETSLDELEAVDGGDDRADPAPAGAPWAGGGAAAAGGAAVGPTRYLARDLERSDYPGYTCDVLITPLEGPDGGEAWHFLVEVEVRWSERGQRRGAVFTKVMLRSAAFADRLAPA